jgi:Ca-activated chloride channel homolog
MDFAYPQARIFLVLAFAAAALAVLALVRKRRALRRLARLGIHQPGILVRPWRQTVKCVLLLLVAGLLGIALLGPQWGWIEEEVPPRRGRDLIVALDVSRSMLAEDVAPNRLERAKADLRGLAGCLERAGGYRVGLITFAERAALLCPLTFDYRSFAEELAEASLQTLRLRGQASWGDGTQISTALDRAGQIIDDDNAAYTDVLLVSDGDDMAPETLAAADALARRGIPVYALGLGDPQHGSLIPVRDRLGRPASLHYRGEVVRTHLQEEVLQAIADRTHGRYFAARTRDLDLDNQLGEMLADKESLKRQTVHRARQGIHRFQWFVAPALVLLLLHWLLSDARRAGELPPEQPNYFNWVRRRSSLRPSRARLLQTLTLASLTVLAAWSLGAGAGPAPLADPWAAFRRGNELLGQAQQAGMNADPAWIIQAQGQYRACLAREAATPNAGSLFDDARYNLELAKLLLLQVSGFATHVGQPPAKSPPQEGDEAAKPNDDKKEKKKGNSGAEKDKTGEQQSQSNAGASSANAGEQNSSSAIDHSSKQAEQKQRQEQQSQGKAGSGPAHSKDAERQSRPQKATRSGPGASSSEGESQQKKQKDEQEQKRNPQKSDNQETKLPFEKGAKRSSGADQGTMPMPPDSSDDDKRGRGRGRGPEPDSRGLFHAETPAANQKPETPERGSQGDANGRGPSKEKSAGAQDAVMEAAVMRLREAIQRIENRRRPRGAGPDPAPEDPANLNRYRDW